MTVCWVITKKDDSSNLMVKAWLVAHGFQETQEFCKDSSTCAKESLFFALDQDNQLMGILACHVDDLLYDETMPFNNFVINSLPAKFEFGTEKACVFTTFA